MDPFHIAMEEHVHPPFELTQWSNNYSQIYQNHHESSNLLGLNHRSENFKVQEDQQEEEEPEEELGAIKEMMFKIAALQPVDIDPATVRKPKRRNLRISDDPQSIAARHRRERISEKIRILQRLVPGGAKMDTATMLEEAARYVRFLKRQIRLLQANPNQAVLSTAVNNNTSFTAVAGPSYNMFGGNYKFDDGANNQSADDLTCLNNKFIGQYY